MFLGLVSGQWLEKSFLFLKIEGNLHGAVLTYVNDLTVIGSEWFVEMILKSVSICSSR